MLPQDAADRPLDLAPEWQPESRAAGKPRSDHVVKTDVEELSPTRVRLTIEVPFDELKSNLDHAYREVGRQVRIPGFRPGHVPRQVLDQRIGRGAVLEHAINEAVPDLYA